MDLGQQVAASAHISGRYKKGARTKESRKAETQKRMKKNRNEGAEEARAEARIEQSRLQAELDWERSRRIRLEGEVEWWKQKANELGFVERKAGFRA